MLVVSEQLDVHVVDLKTGQALYQIFSTLSLSSLSIIAKNNASNL